MFRKLRSGYLKRIINMNALRKGLLGGSPFWRAVWFFGIGRRLWRRVSKSGPGPITFSEPLEEGEAWAMVHVPEKSRRGRGEGRRMLFGPKRRRPRAGALVPPALAAAGRRIVEAPDAARINQILGREVVQDPPPTRRERRAARRQARRTARAATANGAAGDPSGK